MFMDEKEYFIIITYLVRCWGRTHPTNYSFKQWQLNDNYDPRHIILLFCSNNTIVASPSTETAWGEMHGSELKHSNCSNLMFKTFKTTCLPPGQNSVWSFVDRTASHQGITCIWPHASEPIHITCPSFSQAGCLIQYCPGPWLGSLCTDLDVWL